MEYCPICGEPIDDDGYCTNVKCDGYISIFAMEHAKTHTDHPKDIPH